MIRKIEFQALGNTSMKSLYEIVQFRKKFHDSKKKNSKYCEIRQWSYMKSYNLEWSTGMEIFPKLKKSSFRKTQKRRGYIRRSKYMSSEITEKNSETEHVMKKNRRKTTLRNRLAAEPWTLNWKIVLISCSLIISSKWTTRNPNSMGHKTISDYAKIRMNGGKCFGFVRFDQKILVGLRNNSDYAEFTVWRHAFWRLKRLVYEYLNQGCMNKRWMSLTRNARSSGSNATL